MKRSSSIEMPVEDKLIFAAELEAIKAESIGWVPLGAGVYIHQGNSQLAHETVVIQVVGIPDAAMADMNVLLVI